MKNVYICRRRGLGRLWNQSSHMSFISHFLSPLFFIFGVWAEYLSSAWGKRYGYLHTYDHCSTCVFIMTCLVLISRYSRWLVGNTVLYLMIYLRSQQLVYAPQEYEWRSSLTYRTSYASRSNRSRPSVRPPRQRIHQRNGYASVP